VTLELRIEWEEAPGVVAPVLRDTWARLEIQIQERVVTRFWSERTRCVRDAVYTSLFPLARWTVSNWWNLLSEGLCDPSVLRGTRSTARHRAWLGRHNLHCGREGMAYPDLTFYRMDNGHGAVWQQDPPSITTPGRFLDAGGARIDTQHVEAGLAAFVERVIARLGASRNSEADDLRADWSAICRSRTEERELCERLGALGLDPYGEDTIDAERRVAALEFEGPFLRDLLAATSVESLQNDVKMVKRLLKKLPEACLTSIHDRGLPLNGESSDLPYLAGYQRAAAVRKHLGLAPDQAVSDLWSLIRGLLGEPELSWSRGGSTSMEAVVQAGDRKAVSATNRSSRAKRFLLARALHHWVFSFRSGPCLRLITTARDWQQACSRAFAAELLVPAAALDTTHAGWDAVDALARRFDVDPMVITHQLDNHFAAGELPYSNH